MFLNLKKKYCFGQTAEISASTDPSPVLTILWGNLTKITKFIKFPVVPQSKTPKFFQNLGQFDTTKIFYLFLAFFDFFFWSDPKSEG
jgi:hypothetical protein